MHTLWPFLLHWAITAFSLWLVSRLFKGIRFETTGALVISALLLGFANAILRPVLIILTFPLTLVTFGFFLLVINALMLLLVSKLVSGFKISGFWTAFFASIVIALLSLLFGALLSHGDPGGEVPLQVPGGPTWI